MHTDNRLQNRFLHTQVLPALKSMANEDGDDSGFKYSTSLCPLLALHTSFARVEDMYKRNILVLSSVKDDFPWLLSEKQRAASAQHKTSDALLASHALQPALGGEFLNLNESTCYSWAPGKMSKIKAVDFKSDEIAK